MKDRRPPLHLPVALIRQLTRRVASSALFLSWFVTAMRLGNAVFILPLMLRRLHAEEMGFWFILLNFSQLFLFVEMGLLPTLARAVSYFHAGATDIAKIGLGSPVADGAGANWPGLRGLLATSRGLYRWLATIIVVLTVVGGGGWLAWTRPGEFLHPDALATFALLCVAGPACLVGVHWLAFLHGLNLARDVQLIQLRALGVNYAIAFTGLLAGRGMIALALGQATSVVLSRWEARRLVRRRFPELIQGPANAGLPWRRLWSLTWRTGASMGLSYLALPASLVVCGQTLDLRTTASYGLSLQVAILLYGVSMNWLAVKYPVVSQMLVAGQITEARAVVRRRLVASVGTYAAGAVLVWLLGPWGLTVLGSRTPLLDPALLAGLLAIAGADLFAGLHGSVIQCANRSDHLPSLGVTALVNLVLGWWLAREAGVAGLLVALGIGYVLMHLWRTPWQCWQTLRGLEAERAA